MVSVSVVMNSLILFSEKVSVRTNLSLTLFFNNKSLVLLDNIQVF